MIFAKFIPILSTYLSPQMCDAWFYPFFALCFIATVPCIIKALLR